MQEATKTVYTIRPGRRQRAKTSNLRRTTARAGPLSWLLQMDGPQSEHRNSDIG